MIAEAAYYEAEKRALCLEISFVTGWRQRGKLSEWFMVINPSESNQMHLTVPSYAVLSRFVNHHL